MGIYLVYFSNEEGKRWFNIVEANRKRLVVSWAKTISESFEHTSVVELKKARIIKLRGN